MRFKYLFIVVFSIVSVSSFFSQVSTIDFQLAKKYYLDSDYEKAALYYEKIFKEPKHRLKIYENYKSTFIELNKFKEAEKLSKTIIKENPDKLKFLVDLGVIYGLVDRIDKKNQVFDKAIEQINKETSYDNAFDLGLAFEKIGNLEKALEVYLNFESKNLLNPFAFHSKIALIYNKTDQTNKMINTFFEMLDFNNKFLQNVQNGLVNSIDFQNNLKGKFPKAQLLLVDPDQTIITDEEEAIQVLKGSRPSDMIMGRTSVGPHKSDLQAVYEDKLTLAKDCSTGEQKAILISIMLANAKSLAKISNVSPIVLLDEVSAHLDKERQAALYDEICGLGVQAWMTGTGPELFSELKNKAQFIEVSTTDGISELSISN